MRTMLSIVCLLVVVIAISSGRQEENDLDQLSLHVPRSSFLKLISSDRSYHSLIYETQIARPETRTEPTLNDQIPPPDLQTPV